MLSAAPVAAESFRLGLPLDCTLGEDCFIEDYVDHDPAPGAQKDFACAFNSRDGHKGTDIALLGFDRIAEGVAVRAAAPGRVLRARDGMADDPEMTGVTEQNACGNAVLVDHGGGWQTLYCHMREGSVADVITPGMDVEAGTQLGLVGLSGQTNHPHLHLAVMKDGEIVDPFAPDTGAACGTEQETLWAEPPTYYRTGLMTAGFSTSIPSLDAVRSGAARVTRAERDAALVVYAHVAYGETGDLLTVSGRGPDGEVFRKEIVLEQPQVSLVQAFGRKAPPGGWSAGDYVGEVLLTRDGIVIAHRFAEVTVP